MKGPLSLIHTMSFFSPPPKYKGMWYSWKKSWPVEPRFSLSWSWSQVGSYLIRLSLKEGRTTTQRQYCRSFFSLSWSIPSYLMGYIHTQNRFSEDQARYYFRQLIEGVEYCHSQGVCHRDLKPENLLLDEEWNLKVYTYIHAFTYLPLNHIAGCKTIMG